MVPLTPVTIALYEPDGVDDVVETVRVEVPLPPAERAILVVLSEIAGPAGDIEAARLIVPLNPFRLTRAIVELPEEPAGRVMLVGLTVMAKSGFGGELTITVRVAGWDNDPLVPIATTA